MKTSRLISMVILIIAGSFLVNLSAQEALRAVAKKCENMDGITASIIKSKQRHQRSMTSIRFANNEELKKEILAAFEKDKDQADRIIVNKESGKMTSLHYTFGELTCLYSEDENGNVSFSIREIPR